MFVVFQQQEIFPSERTVALQFHNPPVGAAAVIREDLVRLAQRPAIGRLLRQLIVEFGYLRTRSQQLTGELGPLGLEVLGGLLSQRQFPPEGRVIVRQLHHLSFEGVRFLVHAVVAGAQLRQRIAQGHVVGFFLLQ